VSAVRLQIQAARGIRNRHAVVERAEPIRAGPILEIPLAAEALDVAREERRGLRADDGPEGIVVQWTV